MPLDQLHHYVTSVVPPLVTQYEVSTFQKLWPHKMPPRLCETNPETSDDHTAVL